MPKTCGECHVSQNLVWVIGGPTASGKTALALDLALEKNGTIINADSMQIYQGLPIITACPTAEEKAKCPHRLFEILDPSVRGNVVDWLKLAAEEIKKAWLNNQTPVVVGGTGFYLDNLIHGTTPVPPTSPETRTRVNNLLEEKGLKYLWEKLKQIDQPIAERLNAADKTRICRAYEVWLETGIRLSDWHLKPLVQTLPEARFQTVEICPPMSELETRCYSRFDKMLENGALAEVETLVQKGLDESLPAMNALGVPELRAYLKGDLTLAQATILAKQHTRQYAKRQRTWFKNKFNAEVTITHGYTKADLTNVFKTYL